MTMVNPLKKAFLPLCACIMLGSVFVSAPSAAQQGTQASKKSAGEKYSDCMTLVRTQPKRAVSMALTWQNSDGGTPARHCEASGLFALGKYRPAGLMLDRVAKDMRVGKDMPIINGVRQTATQGLLAEVYLQSATAWFRAKDWVMAISAADLAVASANKTSSTYFDSLMIRAQIMASDEDYQSAFDDLTQLKTEYPDNQDILLMYAAAGRMIKKYNLALEALTQILIKDTDNLTALLERGNLFDSMGKTKEAREDWLKIIGLDETSVQATSAQRNLQDSLLKQQKTMMK